ncbi:hypothetical protein NM75_17160, partial [Dickeya fangzhongdai]
MEYGYNRAGQVVSERVNGEEVRSGYDDSGQRSVVEGLLSSLNLGWQGGRLTTLSIGSHQPLTFSHTASGYEQLRSNGEGFALRHEWSATGLLAVQALDGVNGVLERRYQYDVLDRLTGIRDSHWGEQAFRLNGAGQVPSAQAVARVAYRWDGDQLSGQTQYRVDGSVARAVQWVYEPG